MRKIGVTFSIAVLLLGAVLFLGQTLSYAVPGANEAIRCVLCRWAIL